MRIPSNIQVVVLDGRPPIPELVDWLRLVDAPWFVSDWPETHSADDAPWWLWSEARNLIVRKFMAESSRAYLLMVDNDMAPCEQTEETVFSLADVVGARAWSRWGGNCHGSGPGTVGCGFIKISRHALEKIGPNPFDRKKDGCDCAAFCKRARDAGFMPLHVGAVGHQAPVIAMPTLDGGYVMKAPKPPVNGSR